MRRRFSTLSARSAWLLVALAAGAVPSVGVVRTPALQSHPSPPTGSSAPPAASRLRYAGLPNFGVVGDQLYRGAQPDESGFAELARRGIAIVVNLRHESDRIARERTIVERLGLQYVSIPWRGHDEPNPVQVGQFLRLLSDNPQRKVFVHCQRGAERTGVMVACYRISREQWTPERAQAEMEAFGFRRRFAHLTRFVREFPNLLLRDPVLKSISSSWRSVNECSRSSARFAADPRRRPVMAHGRNPAASSCRERAPECTHAQCAR